jgi:hypothetical protein
VQIHVEHRRTNYLQQPEEERALSLLIGEHISMLHRNLSLPEHAGPMSYVFDDGGRAAAGYKGFTGDCACRAIAIATALPYRVVYDALNALAKSERITKRRRKKSDARAGVRNETIRKYLADLGWRWIPTMSIGQGCKVHLRADDLPPGRLIVSVSKHLVAVIDGVIHDNHDCSRAGTRCVYGYYNKD